MSAKVYPSMVDANQSEIEFYPGSGRGGRTSSSGVLGALYCSAPGVPVVGQLQARRERRRGLQVPGDVAEDVVGELESECVGCRMLSVISCLVPCSGGVHLPFIGQGEGELHACCTIQLHGEAWCAAP
jgi:hypothetical protein